MDAVDQLPPVGFSDGHALLLQGGTCPDDPGEWRPQIVGDGPQKIGPHVLQFFVHEDRMFPVQVGETLHRDPGAQQQVFYGAEYRLFQDSVRSC